jgi:uncharacterized protein (DUF2267 family)
MKDPWKRHSNKAGRNTCRENSESNRQDNAIPTPTSETNLINTIASASPITREDFLEHIKKAFRDNVTVNPNQVCRAVFRYWLKHASKGEIEDVKHVLPKALQELWP